MYERILVAIDGGEATRSVLEAACALADSYEAKLGILYVTRPGEIDDELIREAEVEGILPSRDYAGMVDRFAAYQAGGTNMDARRAESVSRLAAEVAEYVVAEAEAYSKKKGAKAVKTFVRSGDAADAIVGVAGSASADLIVMGHTRRSIVGALMHRSVAEAVDGKAKCPCLVLSQ